MSGGSRGRTDGLGASVAGGRRGGAGLRSTTTAAGDAATAPVKATGGNGLAFWKTLGVTVLFMFSVAVLFTVLQVTGLWDWMNPLTRRLATTPALAPHVEMYRLGREAWGDLANERARLTQWETRLSVEEARLAELERTLRRTQNELDLERQRLAAWEAELSARQAAVERLEDEQLALQRVREMYEAMRPQEAARILSDLTDEEVALLLADMDPRTAASILAALPTEKATVVSRRLGL